MKNVFGLNRYEPKDIFTDDKVVQSLKMMLDAWLSYLGVKNINEVRNRTINSFRNYSVKTGLIDEELRKYYQQKGIIDSIKKNLQQRADWIYCLVQRHINGNVIDVGCGPGEIAQKLADRKKMKVQLTDVADIPLRKKFAPNLPFYHAKEGEKLPFKENQFDSGLLITVMHHSNNPFFLLDELKRTARGNIAIIESVYGIDIKQSPSDEVRKYPMMYKGFHALDEEQQRKYGTFLDWFLNKMILGNEINCPYNFTTPENWEKIFDEKGFELVHKQMLGIDQPVTPEYHVLYIIKKKN
jgi:SAM-dependent methyltransferase